MKFLKDFGAIVAIIIAALGGAVTYGALSADVKSVTARVERIEPNGQQNSTDIAVLKAATDRIENALNRIEDRLGTKGR